MTALKKKSETCEEQLRRMCKSIANSISEPQQITDEETGEKREETTHDWMEDVYDIEWITHRDHSYRAARLLVAGGGPTIWVNTLTDNVEGYWWGCDKVSLVFFDNIGLDDYLREMHANETAVLTS